MRKFLLLLCTCLFLLSFKVHSWAGENFENISKLVIKGEASVLRPADQMEVTLGVVTSANSSSQALSENNKLMGQVVANLRGVGLDESDYQTGRFRIQPIYNKPPENYREDWHPTISHYEVVNAIQIKTQKISLADKIIDAAVQGGANQIEKVNFNLNNPQAYRDEAIQLATQNALADANTLARAARVRLLRVLYLSLDQWQNRPVPLMLSKTAGIRESGTPLEAGNVEIQATVHMTFAITPEKT